MIWFAFVAAAVLAAALVWWTFATADRLPNPAAWKRAAATILTFGLIPAFWFGFGLRYSWADTVQVQGFPIPVAFFVFEHDQWVDYIGFPPLGILNVFILDAFLLSPLLVVMRIVLYRQRPARGD